MGWLFPFLVSNNQREIVNLIRVYTVCNLVSIVKMVKLPKVKISYFNFRTSSTNLGVSENLAY